MSIVRTSHNRDNPYVILNKSALEDFSISWAAKGLWSYLMSRPDDWTVSVAHLSRLFLGKGGGERAIYSLINELINAGYCNRSQRFNDKGQFEKLEYVITELKNKVPHRSQADAAEAGPLESATTNEGVLPSTERSDKRDDAVFYESIKDLAISDKDKKTLMKHPEDEVNRAIAFATHPSTKIKTSLIKTIMWALKEKPDIPDIIDVEGNKNYAQSEEQCLVSEYWIFEALNEKIYIYSKNPTTSKTYEMRYDDKRFKEEFGKIIRECRFVNLKSK